MPPNRLRRSIPNSALPEPTEEKQSHVALPAALMRPRHTVLMRPNSSNRVSFGDNNILEFDQTKPPARLCRPPAALIAPHNSRRFPEHTNRPVPDAPDANRCELSAKRQPPPSHPQTPVAPGSNADVTPSPPDESSSSTVPSACVGVHPTEPPRVPLREYDGDRLFASYPFNELVAKRLRDQELMDLARQRRL